MLPCFWPALVLPTTTGSTALMPWQLVHVALAVHAIDVFGVGTAAFVPFEWQYVFAHV